MPVAVEITLVAFEPKSDEEEHMKNIGLLTLLITVTFMLMLAFPAAAAAPETHPHIHAALEAMRSAKQSLEAAAHEFHGHRVKAIEHLNEAIHEAEICEQEK